MATPVLLTVDDEPQVLSAVERDLRRHYRSDYRVVKAGSGAEALEALRELKEREVPVALLLSDQRMPAMTGTEFLAQAQELYPQAKRVLLTAYADTEAAISAINEVGLDHYLMKPWDPPEERLYPTLDDLLSDWAANADVPYDGIRVAGAMWSPGSHAVKDFLARNRVPYQWLDVDKDETARALVAGASDADGHLPVVFFPDGTHLVTPDPRALADKVGLQTQATSPFYDVVIIGGGPAGLGAGVYAATEGLRAALIEREATGGQAGTSSRIENYLGFPNGISGSDLATRATAQARRFGCEILTTQEVAGVRAEGPARIVTLADGSELTAKAVVVATGVSLRELEVPGAAKHTGAGLYYGAAVSEASHYQGERVFVVGGANSAGQGAMFLSRYAATVTMLVRASDLSEGMSQYLIDEIASRPNIEVLCGREVVSVNGEGALDGVSVKDRATGASEHLAGKAVFVFIGAQAHTGPVDGVVARSPEGFILTGPDLVTAQVLPKNWPGEGMDPRDPFPLETSVPGVFAVGDVRHNVVRRVASAVGEGSISIAMVHRYLQTI
jgi:thioredoxin reductase (NADPH)